MARRTLAAIAAAALAAFAIGVALWLHGSAPPPDRAQWVQLTKLPDSASQPALSPDGRMLAFIRGYDTFFGPGKVYVKILPDGEPVQLTHDNLLKMSPTFSPDGSRIAYTTVDPQFNWDTWVVPTLSGEPQPLLRNASGLVWIVAALFEKRWKFTGNRCGRGEPHWSARCTFCPPTSLPWRIGPLITRWEIGTFGGNGSGPPGCPVVWFPWTAAHWANMSALSGAAARPRRGRTMVAGCISLLIPVEPIISGGNDFPMASRNRSLPAPPKRKAWPWHQTALLAPAVALQNTSLWVHDANG